MILEPHELDALADAIADRLRERGAALPPEPSPWMNLEQALAYTSLSRSSFEKLRAKGLIPTHQIEGEGTIVYHRAELDRALGAASATGLRSVA